MGDAALLIAGAGDLGHQRWDVGARIDRAAPTERRSRGRWRFLYGDPAEDKGRAFFALQIADS